MCQCHVACPFRARAVHAIRWPTDVRNWAAAGLRGASTLSESRLGSGIQVHAVKLTLEGKMPQIVSGTVSEGGSAAWIDLTEASLRRKRE